jgi:hypothetical protein
MYLGNLRLNLPIEQNKKSGQYLRSSYSSETSSCNPVYCPNFFDHGSLILKNVNRVEIFWSCKGDVQVSYQTFLHFVNPSVNV